MVHRASRVGQLEGVALASIVGVFRCQRHLLLPTGVGSLIQNLTSSGVLGLAVRLHDDLQVVDPVAATRPECSGRQAPRALSTLSHGRVAEIYYEATSCKLK